MPRDSHRCTVPWLFTNLCRSLYALRSEDIKIPRRPRVLISWFFFFLYLFTSTQKGILYLSRFSLYSAQPTPSRFHQIYILIHQQTKPKCAPLFFSPALSPSWPLPRALSTTLYVLDLFRLSLDHRLTNHLRPPASPAAASLTATPPPLSSPRPTLSVS